MKDKFIEKDGLLFLMCEPEPLEMDSEMPCLAHLIQDGSRMGIYNRKRYNDKQLASYYVLCWHIYSRDCVSCGDHYSRYEIVAKHCPEGSREWALWQILNGKKVRNLANKEATYACGAHLSTAAWFLDNNLRDGWYIYEEPKPEVGKWYTHPEYSEYLQCYNEYDGYMRFRKAGQKDDNVLVFDNKYKKLTPVSLEPDFSNAKVGDEVFAVARGTTSIREIRKKPYPIRTKTYSFTKCGRHMDTDKHPILFHSVAQCAAYFAEVALKERGEQC